MGKLIIRPLFCCKHYGISSAHVRTHTCCNNMHVPGVEKQQHLDCMVLQHVIQLDYTLMHGGAGIL